MFFLILLLFPIFFFFAFVDFSFAMPIRFGESVKWTRKGFWGKKTSQYFAGNSSTKFPENDSIPRREQFNKVPNILVTIVVVCLSNWDKLCKCMLLGNKGKKLRLKRCNIRTQEHTESSFTGHKTFYKLHPGDRIGNLLIIFGKLILTLQGTSYFRPLDPLHSTSANLIGSNRLKMQFETKQSSSLQLYILALATLRSFVNFRLDIG